jgi:hypothetical protein
MPMESSVHAGKSKSAFSPNAEVYSLMKHVAVAFMFHQLLQTDIFMANLSVFENTWIKYTFAIKLYWSYSFNTI